MQNLSEKCTQWYGNGPKMANFGEKNAIFGHTWPQRLQMAGKSGSKGGSQWNTCGGTTLVAKLVRKMHPMVWKWPKNGQYWAKTQFLAISGPRDPRWLVKVEQMVDHSRAHVGGLL